MPRSLDEMLERHQRQCDYRYVHWLWMAGILAALLLTGGGAGWFASQTLADVRTDTTAVRDSVRIAAMREVVQERRIEALEVRSRVLDSLTVWVPRIEHTAVATQEMVRRWGR